MTEQTTALAPAPDALPAKPAKPTRSLIADLAEAAGIDPGNFLAAVKAAASCKGATNEHFMVLLMQAQKYALDPLSSPPMLQLLDVGQGPQVYARVDAYKAFIHRAKNDGVIEWTRYEECWVPDPAQSPDKAQLIRAGRYTGKFKREPEPVTELVYWREWNTGKGQWVTRGSQMLRHRSAKEWCREHLGYYLADEDDAARMGDSNAPRHVQVEVRDSERADPAIPIPSLRRPGATTFAPPPTLEPEESPEGGSRATERGSATVVRLHAPLTDDEGPQGNAASPAPVADIADSPATASPAAPPASLFPAAEDDEFLAALGDVEP